MYLSSVCGVGEGRAGEGRVGESRAGEGRVGCGVFVRSLICLFVCYYSQYNSNSLVQKIRINLIHFNSN